MSSNLKKYIKKLLLSTFIVYVIVALINDIEIGVALLVCFMLTIYTSLPIMWIWEKLEENEKNEESAIFLIIIIIEICFSGLLFNHMSNKKKNNNQIVNQSYINNNGNQNYINTNSNQNYVAQNNNDIDYVGIIKNKNYVLDETSVENLGNNIYKGRFYNKNTYESYFISVDRNTCHYHTIQIIYNDGKDVKKYYTNKENRYFENTKKLCEFINK